MPVITTYKTFFVVMVYSWAWGKQGRVVFVRKINESPNFVRNE
jgi:hypothetical protein